MTFQSTHPRRVRRPLPPSARKRAEISIHAPAKGATAAGAASTTCAFYFNPRTREGCDPQRTGRSAGSCDFNPRTREGCDISPRGRSDRSAHFNPRTREGCDEDYTPVIDPETGFQSTHPRRVRRHFGQFQISSFTFQSTHPRRVRRGFDYSKALCDISIHAPAKGATFYGVFWTDILIISIHAPAKGATANQPGSSSHPFGRDWTIRI